MGAERYPLRKLILDDLFACNKIALLLLLGMIASAVATIWIIHNTRQLISGRFLLPHQCFSDLRSVVKGATVGYSNSYRPFHR